MKVYNYSHPLTKDLKTDLEERLGDFQEVRVNVQIDLTRNIVDQVEPLLEGLIVDMFKGDALAVIPPSLPSVAYLIGRRVGSLIPGGLPFIWLRRADRSQLVFEVGGIE